MAQNLSSIKSIQISESSRSKEPTFSESVPNSSIGPQPNNTSTGDDIAVNQNTTSTIYTWKVMSAGDAGLKDAIYDFINTTKEGVKVTPNIAGGREKKLVFNFYGTMGKSIAPGEIGEFEVIFKYPPTVGGSGTIVINNGGSVTKS